MAVLDIGLNAIAGKELPSSIDRLIAIFLSVVPVTILYTIAAEGTLLCVYWEEY